MRNTILIWLLILPVLVSAQRRQDRFELVFMGGTAAYNGDLGGDQTKFTSDYLEKLGPALGLGVRMHVTNFLALRGNFNYAMVSGADSLSNDPDRKARNLSFRSPIYEGSLLIELSLFNWRHLLGEKVNSTRGGRTNLYLFGGMSFFKFRPEGYYQDRWYELQPFGTEGQGIKPNTPNYKLSSSALVYGFGLRFHLGGRVSLGYELGVRQTNTDYLDDVSKEHWDNGQIEATYGQVAAALADRRVENGPLPQGSQRGNSGVKDYFGFSQLTLAFKLGKSGNSQGGGGRGFRTRNRCFQF